MPEIARFRRSSACGKTARDAERHLAARDILKLYRFLTEPDDASFCHRVTAALNRGWLLHGAPSLAYDARNERMNCGQAIVKEVEGRDYAPEMDLSRQ